MRPHTPCSTRSDSTLSRLISTVWRVTKPNLAMTRLVVMAISVERIFTAATRKQTRATATTTPNMIATWLDSSGAVRSRAKNTMPASATASSAPRMRNPACDHHVSRARCTTSSPAMSESSM